MVGESKHDTVRKCGKVTSVEERKRERERERERKSDRSR